MTLHRLPIRWKITVLTFGIILFSLLIASIIFLGQMVKLKEEELGQRSLIIARTVAGLPEIKGNILRPDGWKTIQPIAERVRMINHADYVVVMDMNRRRLSHPLPERIGTVSRGTDEGPAFAEHSYVSKAKGEQGLAVRAFVPVMNEKHEQVGVVVVGHLLPGVYQIIYGLRGQLSLTILLSLLFGVWGSWLLARHIKRQMYELEPHEIARILRERTATFHALHEGVIAIDNQETITIFNEKAKQMLGIHGEVVGKKIREVIPDTRLPEILERNHPIYNRDLRIGNKIIFSNRIPIKVNGQTVGAVAIFQDRTEVTRLAEELTGVKTFVDALRVQNHEYMNKLHTIAGLIQLGHHEKALDYVFQITEKQEELTRFLSESIRDESLAGLLLSKISRGKELGVEVTVDRNSSLTRFPDHLDRHDFVLILGNLLENAFDALQSADRERKEVYVSIEQDDEILSILVEDNGCGMSEEMQKKIFEQGFTTKKESGHGIGLHLVRQIVEKGNGKIEVDSAPGRGASFLIIFPMTGRNDHVAARDDSRVAD